MIFNFSILSLILFYYNNEVIFFFNIKIKNMSSNNNMARRSHKNTAARRPSNNRTLNTAAKRQLNPAETLYLQNEIKYKAKFKTSKPTANEWVYNKIIAEILLQFYLISVDYRKMAEIKLNDVSDAIKDDIKTYLTASEIPFKIEKDKYKSGRNVYYLYLFKKESDMTSITNNRGVSVADQLGEFYTCKSQYDEWKDYEWRIVILCDNIELFAQMCTEDQIAKNMKTSMKIYNEVRDLFIILDTPRFTKNDPNPLKISIYKTKAE